MNDLFSNHYKIDFSNELSAICYSFRLTENVFCWQVSQRENSENTYRLLIRELPYPNSPQIEPIDCLVLTIIEKNLITKIGRWEVLYGGVANGRKIEKIPYNQPQILKQLILQQAEISLKNYHSNSEKFACCSKWQQCANEEQCIHENLLYSTSCQYRKNLENGNNFLKQEGKMRFVALDCETANRYRHSICQIGCAVFENGEVVDKFETLINPQQDFEPMNISIHGIKPTDVVNSPLFIDITANLIDLFANSPVVHYGHFDRSAFAAAGFPDISRFFDITRAVRHIYKLQRGYGLSEMCHQLNIPLNQHHNALADAIAAGQIFWECVKQSNQTSIIDFINYFEQQQRNKIKQKKQQQRAFLSNLSVSEQGVLKGETVCFTGTLENFTRSEIQQIVAYNGGRLSEKVIQTTTILVVGSYDKITNKQIKAKQLIEKGQQIQIISETELLSMLKF